jgi:glycosyltransferase involved in cell wall biosynthesis
VTSEEADIIRVAIVADLPEERWHSMDLVANALFDTLTNSPSARDLSVEVLRPSLPRPHHGVRRFIKRFWDYPRWLRQRRQAFDVFHVIDHSYAHLVHVLPPERTVVTCHDIDAFLSILEPDKATSRLPWTLVRRVLDGMRKAAYVTCDSRATYEELRRYDLIPPARLVIVPNGVHAAYTPRPASAADCEVARLLGPRSSDCPELLHVGSSVPRKGIEFLLHIVAAVRGAVPGVRLIKAGGALTGAQHDLAAALGLEPAITEVPELEVDRVAALYRRASVVLVPSAREGFGLPVIEALACGTPVVATDLPVLREVGGAAARYAPFGEIGAWRKTIVEILQEDRDPAAGERRRAGCVQAGKFSWDSHGEAMARLYRRLFRARGLPA